MQAGISTLPKFSADEVRGAAEAFGGTIDAVAVCNEQAPTARVVIRPQLQENKVIHVVILSIDTSRHHVLDRVEPRVIVLSRSLDVTSSEQYKSAGAFDK